MDDRLISLNAAIELICTEGTRLERNGTVAMAEIKQWCVDLLEALPSAQPGWIPCTPETMPESNDEVFVTYTVNGKKHRYVETATWYDGDEGYWSSPWDEYRVPGTKVEVIAWMPLPKPYTGKGGDTNEPDKQTD